MSSIIPTIIPPNKNPMIIHISCSSFAFLYCLCLIKELISDNFDLIKKFTNAKARKNIPTNTIKVTKPAIRKKMPKIIQRTSATLFKDIIVSAELGIDSEL